jgi:hypothetical protein
VLCHILCVLQLSFPVLVSWPIGPRGGSKGTVGCAPRRPHPSAPLHPPLDPLWLPSPHHSLHPDRCGGRDSGPII